MTDLCIGIRLTHTTKGVQEDEIELDIDELSNEVLYKLLGFVRKYAPRPNDLPPARQAPAPAPVQASHPKKNKPMSKNEQEAKIREIRSRLSGFQNVGSDQSPEPGKCFPTSCIIFQVPLLRTY